MEHTPERTTGPPSSFRTARSTRSSRGSASTDLPRPKRGRVERRSYEGSSTDPDPPDRSSISSRSSAVARGGPGSIRPASRSRLRAARAILRSSRAAIFFALTSRRWRLPKVSGMTHLTGLDFTPRRVRQWSRNTNRHRCSGKHVRASITCLHGSSTTYRTTRGRARTGACRHQVSWCARVQVAVRFEQFPQAAPRRTPDGQQEGPERRRKEGIAHDDRQREVVQL
jgi:hypothetical protein